MRLRTINNIDFKACSEQALRFADDEFKLQKTGLPKDLKNNPNATYGKVDIKVKIKSLMYPFFYATIQYIQNWTETKEIPAFDSTGLPNGTETITQDQSKVFVQYDMNLPYENIEVILDAIDPLIAPEIIGKERIERKIMAAILQDVLDHKTLITEDRPNGQLAEDYETIIE